jgi:hypothetical protein
VNITSPFIDQVFDYINTQYGKNMLKTVQINNNKSVVDKIVTSSMRQEDTVEHTANKIIAMLRINP